MDGHFEWGDIKVFLAIVRTGSFGKAAEQLGLTQPTISRRVDQLEKRIGKQLFKRTASGALLTSEAESLVVIAEKMNANAAAIDRMTATDVARGRVIVRVPDVLAQCVVMPQLGTFLREHPHLSVVVDSTIHETGEQPDISLQFFDPRNNALRRTPVCWVHYSCFASVEYLEEHPTPDSFAQFAGHRVVHHTDYGAYKKNWSAEASAVGVLIEKTMVATNSGPLNIQAIQHGVGVGALPTIACEKVPGLVPLPVGCAGAGQLWMYHDKGSDNVNEIAVCRQWLLDIFSPERVRWFGEEYLDPVEWMRTMSTEKE